MIQGGDHSRVVHEDVGPVGNNTKESNIYQCYLELVVVHCLRGAAGKKPRVCHKSNNVTVKRSLT